MYVGANTYLPVKWLGKDTIAALAVDGKGGKAELLERVARWVAASGRNVTQPGKHGSPLLYMHIYQRARSHDRIV